MTTSSEIIRPPQQSSQIETSSSASEFSAGVDEMPENVATLPLGHPEKLRHRLRDDGGRLVRTAAGAGRPPGVSSADALPF